MSDGLHSFFAPPWNVTKIFKECEVNPTKCARFPPFFGDPLLVTQSLLCLLLLVVYTCVPPTTLLVPYTF